MTVTQVVEALLRRLPEDCTFEDIQYHLYVMQKIRTAEDSIASEGGVPHDQAKRRISLRMKQWLAG